MSSTNRYPPLVDLEDDVDPRERDLMRIDAMLQRAHSLPMFDITQPIEEPSLNDSILNWLREQFG